MRKGLLRALIVLSCLAAAVPAFAIPTLQLDIAGGTYDSTTETIVASSSTFTVYAYLIPDSKNTLLDTYYISMATNPATGPDDVALGSFSVNGTTIDVTEDMTYGTAPLEDIVEQQGWDKGDLAKHSIFPTFFYQQGFGFSETSQISQYNTQDRATLGGSIPTSESGMYYMAFDIDTSGLDAGYVIHFDLYNTRILNSGDSDITQFAPFSHDAESCVNCTSVPEPSTLLLLGSGLLGLGLLGRNSRKKV